MRRIRIRQDAGREYPLLPGLPDAASEEEEISGAVQKIQRSLQEPEHHAYFELKPDLMISAGTSPALAFAFSTYEPQRIGVIDYHSAQRQYQRERIGGINVNITENADKMAQHALYNWQAKYSNLKSELAAAYIRDLLIEKAGGAET